MAYRPGIGAYTEGPRRGTPAILAIAGLALAALVWLIATSPARLVYDEFYYQQGPEMLVRGATFLEFLKAPLYTPAGPLYATIHWLASPLTHLHQPAIRWPNLVLLVSAAGATAYALRSWGYEEAWPRVAMLLAVPIVWVTTGMALTEIPAFALVSFGIAAVAWAMTAPAGEHRRIWAGFALAGLCLGGAILGRQPYLPAAGGFVMIALFDPRLRWPALLAAALAIAVPLPVFMLWGGMVPPSVAFVGGGIKLEFGARSFAYLTILFLILAPAFFLPHWRWALGAGVGATFLAMVFSHGKISVASGIVGHLPPALANLVQLAAASVFLGIGAAVVVAALANAWDRREDRLFVLLTLLTLGLAATPAAVVHLFSSRYLMSAFPFALFIVQPWFAPSRWAALRLGGGAVLGYLSLAAYLHAVPAAG